MNVIIYLTYIFRLHDQDDETNSTFATSIPDFRLKFQSDIDIL